MPTSFLLLCEVPMLKMIINGEYKISYIKVKDMREDKSVKDFVLFLLTVKQFYSKHPGFYY